MNKKRKSISGLRLVSRPKKYLHRVRSGECRFKAICSITNTDKQGRGTIRKKFTSCLL